ncbi:hypothetical protein T05_6907 [Trichinella murrelli]|uniref:Uncharacterized protein n=1 Tax=Trichinella murrelli TaxID=144512 RepID=A0A0V0UD13_9BILA|nr:hypothetical protein T05_6907 [Trichinella murrelli]
MNLIFSKKITWHVCRSLAKDVHKVCMYIENNVSIINKHDLSIGIIFENYGKQRCSSIDCMAAAMEFEFFEIDLEVDKIEKRKFPMRNANMQSFLQRSINKRVNRKSNK